jgi:hypothetical protein
MYTIDRSLTHGIRINKIKQKQQNEEDKSKNKRKRECTNEEGVLFYSVMKNDLLRNIILSPSGCSSCKKWKHWFDGDKAAYLGYHSMIKERKNYMKFTAACLSKACEGGSIDTVKLVLEMSTCSNEKYAEVYFGDHAVKCGNLELVKWIIDNIVDDETDKSLTSRHCFSTLSLCYAAENEDIEALNMLWENRHKLVYMQQVREFINRNAMNYAVCKGNIKAMAWLHDKERINHGGVWEIASHTKSPIPVLDAAVSHKQKDAALWIVENNIETEDGGLLAYFVEFAFEMGDTELAKKLLLELHTCIEYMIARETILSAAARSGKLESLILAESLKSPRIIDLHRSKRKSDIKSETYKHTILDDVFYAGDLKAINWCFSNGYDGVTLNGIRNVIGKVHIEKIHWLIENIKSYIFGESDLHSAVNKNRMDIINLIYYKNPTRHSWGTEEINSALPLATKHGYLDVLKWIKDALGSKYYSGLDFMRIEYIKTAFSNRNIDIIKWYIETCPYLVEYSMKTIDVSDPVVVELLVSFLTNNADFSCMLIHAIIHANLESVKMILGGPMKGKVNMLNLVDIAWKTASHKVYLYLLSLDDGLIEYVPNLS